MEYKINNKPKSQKEIEITIQPEEIKKHLIEAAQKLSLNTKIKGFRPGKAPVGIVQEILGKEKVWQEACYEAINEVYPEILGKEKLNVISAPEIKIDKIKPEEPLEFKAMVSIFPIITIPEYKEKAKNILKEKKEINISDDEVSNMIDTIRKTRAKIVRVLRESQNGDEVIIDFQGKINGIVQENLKGNKVPIIIGETKFIEGFIEKITGMKENEEKVFSLEVSLTKDVKKEVEFSVKILAVNERELPEMTDDFARSVGNFPDGVKDLKKKIKENIRLKKENKEKERLRMKIMEEISKDSSVEIPDILINREIDNMLYEFKERFNQRGGSFENYLKETNKTEEKIKEEWKNEAEKRIIISLILQEIAKKEEIKIEDKEIEKEMATYLSQINDESVRQKIDKDQLRLYFKNMTQNKKVFEILEI